MSVRLCICPSLQLILLHDAHASLTSKEISKEIHSQGFNWMVPTNTLQTILRRRRLEHWKRHAPNNLDLSRARHYQYHERHHRSITKINTCARSRTIECQLFRTIRFGTHWGPLHTRDWKPVTITFQALSLVEKAEPVQVRYFTLCLRDQQSMWMQDGCKVYMDSYMTSTGSCFMVTWTIFKNHLLEVGLIQNWETMALRTLTTIDLFYFNHVWGLTQIEIYYISIWLRARWHMTSHYTWEDPWPHNMILEASRDGLWILSFGLSQDRGHGFWLVCEVALICSPQRCHNYGLISH